jgi:hypothetical protein
MTALEHVVAMEGGVDRLKFLPRRQTMILYAYRPFTCDGGPGC